MAGLSMADQVSGEEEQQRRKRMAALQSSSQLPSGMSSLAEGYGSALGMT
jgi:hypothetical protein